MLVNHGECARLVWIGQLDEPSRHELEEVPHVMRRLDAILFHQVPCGVVHRAGNLDAKIVLARVAVMRSRPWRPGTSPLHRRAASEPAIVSNRRRILAKGIFGAIHTRGQRHPILGGIGSRLHLRLAGERGTEPIFDSGKWCPPGRAVCEPSRIRVDEMIAIRRMVLLQLQPRQPS